MNYFNKLLLVFGWPIWYIVGMAFPHVVPSERWAAYHRSRKAAVYANPIVLGAAMRLWLFGFHYGWTHRAAPDRIGHTPYQRGHGFGRSARLWRAWH